MDRAGSQQDTKGGPSGPLRYLQDGPSVADANRRANGLTKAPTQVHNHGPYEGPGIACRESTINGYLVGDCMITETLRVRVDKDSVSCTIANCQTCAEEFPVTEDTRAVCTLREVEQGLSLGLRFFLRSGVEIVRGR